MKTTANNNKTNETFTFVTCDGNMAKRKAEKKFGLSDITIREEETGEEFPLIDEWLSESAYVSRCMVSGQYHLYIRDTWDGKTMTFAPVIGVTKEIVPETIVNEYNECEADKTTHKIGNWYVGFPKAEIKGVEYAFKDYCENHGKIKFEKL